MGYPDRNLERINDFLSRQIANAENARMKLARSCRIASEKPYAVFSIPSYDFRAVTKVYCSANLDRALGKAVKLRLNGSKQDGVTYMLVEWDGASMQWKEYKYNGVDETK